MESTPRSCVLALLICLALSTLSSCTGSFFTSENIFDSEHISEHIMGFQTLQQNTVDEAGLLRFGYFSSHDTDNNKMLDGLEILAALSHLADHHHDGQPHSHTGDPVEMIDQTLITHDTDRDGYLSYAEYCRASDSSLLTL